VSTTALSTRVYNCDSHTHTASPTMQESAWPKIDGGAEITIHTSKHRAMHRRRGGQRALRQGAGGGWVQRATEGIKVVKPRDKVVKPRIKVIRPRDTRVPIKVVKRRDTRVVVRPRDTRVPIMSRTCQERWTCIGRCYWRMPGQARRPNPVCECLSSAHRPILTASDTRSSQ
jgi:hypothetical protein